MEKTKIRLAKSLGELIRCMKAKDTIGMEKWSVNVLLAAGEAVSYSTDELSEFMAIYDAAEKDGYTF